MTDSPDEVMTVVFTDIIDSTSMEGAFGLTYDRALDEHDTIVLTSLAKWDGEKINTAGDSFFLLFKAPEKAIQCMHEILCCLKAHSWPTDLPINIRVGMHTGRVRRYLRAGQIDCRGDVVNIASRISSMAQAGQILVSSRTQQDAKKYLPEAFIWQDCGERELKNVGKEKIWQVCHPDLAPPEAFSSPVKAASAASHVNNNLPHLPNPHFIGRDREIAVIHHLLQNQKKQPVALTGMGGMGKTQLASEYAHTHLADYPGGVFWLNAQDETRLLEDFANIGKRCFGLSDQSDPERSAEQTREALLRQEKPALLIFDNVTETFDWKHLPTTGHLQILLTTQRQSLPENIPIVTLKPLSEKAASLLLTSFRPAKTPQEKEAVRKIVGIVGSLPLALALSTSYIETMNVSFPAFLSRLEKDISGILKQARKRFQAATRHDGRIFDTFYCICKELKADAIQIMRTAVCFAPRGISRELLFQASGLRSQERFDDALADLWSRSLVRYEAEQDERLTVHELVQAYFRENLRATKFDETLTTTVRTLARRLSELNNQKKWPQARLEIAHCYHAGRLCHLRGGPSGCEELFYEIGRYLWEQRNLPEALDYYTRGQGIAEERQGPQSLSCARFMRGLSEVYQAQGDEKQALLLARRARILARRRLEAEAPEMPDFYITLGYVLRKQSQMHGDLTQQTRASEELRRALGFYRRALCLYKQTYGAQHPKVAMCLNNIGSILEDQGDLSGALTHYQQALAIDEGLHGPEHITLAVYLNSSGRVLGKQGDWLTALKRHRRALAICKATYADPHIDTALSLFYLAEAQQELDAAQEAETFYLASLDIFITCCGPDHYQCDLIRERLKALHQPPPKDSA